MLKSDKPPFCRCFYLGLGIISLIFTAGMQAAMADSGCVRCHTDEKKLLKYLTKETVSKSSQTQGTG